MDKVWIPFIAFMAVIIQTTVLPFIAVVGMTPDLVLLVVLFLALQKPNTTSLWTAFAIGLVQDIAGGGPLGLNALILVGLVYLVGYLRKQFFKENFTAQIIIVLVFTWIHQFTLFFWMNTIMNTQFGFTSWIGKALILSILHALIAPLLYKWLAQFIHGENIFKHLIGQHKSRLRHRN